MKIVRKTKWIFVHKYDLADIPVLVKLWARRKIISAALRYLGLYDYWKVEGLMTEAMLAEENRWFEKYASAVDEKNK